MPDVFGGFKERPIWVAWDNKGGRKVPKSPGGGNAKSNDPATWGTFEQAQDAAKKHGYTGVGIMLTDGLVGIDLDHCVKVGKIEPWAKEIIDSMGGYAELSPSGTGVHIIGYADPAVVGAIGRADHKRGIEIYNHGRYFTVTGNAIGKGSVSDCTSQVASFMETTFPAPSKEDRATDQLKTLVSSQVMRLANETMVKNVGRDSGRGVRFARVPQGRETCLFCIMLASRGFVYHTKETAGEFSHYHAHCDCKVVPGLEGTSIEGYDPDQYLDLWAQGRALKEGGYSKSQIDAFLKGASIESLGTPNSGVGGRPKAFAKAFPVYLNRSTRIYRNAKHVKPIPGFMDVTIHCDGAMFWYTNADEGDRAKWTMVTIGELAEFISQDPSWDGSPIRLLACRSGVSPSGPARQLADYLGKKVMAPTTDVCIDREGRIALTNNDNLVKAIYNGEIPDEGEWIVFNPKGE